MDVEAAGEPISDGGSIPPISTIMLLDCRIAPMRTWPRPAVKSAQAAHGGYMGLRWTAIAILVLILGCAGVSQDKTITIDGATYHRFDGKLPDNWPGSLRLPRPFYILENDSNMMSDLTGPHPTGKIRLLAFPEHSEQQLVEAILKSYPESNNNIIYQKNRLCLYIQNRA